MPPDEVLHRLVESIQSSSREGILCEALTSMSLSLIVPARHRNRYLFYETTGTTGIY